MTAEHAALNGDRVRELVADVLAEFDVWAELWAPDAAAIGRTKEEAVRHVLYDVRTELSEHLCIRLGLTLSSWGVDS